MLTRWLRLGSVVGAMVCGGCTRVTIPYMLPPRPDDVQFYVRDCDHVPQLRAYTFRYDRNNKSDPCDFDTDAMVDESKVVFLNDDVDHCLFQGKRVGFIRLRHDWDQPTTRP